jgi:leader peptidase (prepilin peptidase)/N-methyltransferase
MEIVLAAILGWLCGVLVNYLADVLPVTRRFSVPVCTACEKPRSLVDVFLLRSCSACHAKRSLRSWGVQIFFLATSVYLFLNPPARLGYIAGIGLLAFFGVIFVIDLEYRLVLHPVSLAGAAIGLVVGIWQKGLEVTLIGGAAGFAIMFGLYYLGIQFNKLMARIRHQEIDEVALGFGDVNLAGVVGLMLGWPEIVGGLLLAILLGGAVSLLIIVGMALLRRYKAMMAIPYAPFILLGAVIFLYIPKQ